MTGALEEALAAIGSGDTSGSETLARYLYQCKVAVQRWLATIELADDAFVLCEFVDDITTVTASEICFAQVKTRDRGAWTAAKVPLCRRPTLWFVVDSEITSEVAALRAHCGSGIGVRCEHLDDRRAAWIGD